MSRRSLSASLVLLMAGSALLSAPAAAGGTPYPTFERVSVKDDEGLSDKTSMVLTDGVSKTGRYMVFTTEARLVPADTDTGMDVFLRDLQLDRTELITVDAPGGAPGGGLWESISDDGCRVAFASGANYRPDLGSQNAGQVFVRDRCAVPATFMRASVFSGTTTTPFPGADAGPISGNGRYVLMTSIADLSKPPAVGCGTTCLLVHDLQTGTTARVDVSSAGIGGNGEIVDGMDFRPSADISDNGRFVAFISRATNLVPNDTTSGTDAFVHDRDTDADGIYDEPGQISTVRISAMPDGTQVSDNGVVAGVVISGNGKVAAFGSLSSTLVPGDTNPGGGDVFVRDLETGQMERTGRQPAGDSNPPEGSSCCGNPGMYGLSDDGTRVSFTGYRLYTPEPGVTVGVPDAFVRDLATGTTHRLSDSGADREAGVSVTAMSGNGKVVALSAMGTNKPGFDDDIWDVFAAGELVANPTTTRQPDGRIRAGTAGAFVGDNVYNTTALGQSKKGSAPVGGTITFGISVQNDGTAADSFTLLGAGSTTMYTVKYLNGPTDVTSAVIAGTYTTPSIAPGGTHLITVTVKVKSNATASSKVARRVTMTSVADSTKKDSVKFIGKRA